MDYVAPQALKPVPHNVGSWLNENEKFFLPPVCNKMMHNTQLKVFYVGGPNQRKDYHLEEGEELFYMRKGNMCLKILEHGSFRDVHIREGEVFLLPGKIPHSPQREANTVGLVIERERLQDKETDGLRYYLDDGSTNALFERWFFCQDLGSQLGPIITEFFASEEHKTGRPKREEISEHPPWRPDVKRPVARPFNLKAWIEKNRPDILKNDHLRLFDETYQSDVLVLGLGCGGRSLDTQGGETFLWQLEGQAKLDIDGTEFIMREDDTILIPEGTHTRFSPQDSGTVALTTKMDPNNKARSES
eukprot:maker-scaffold712_size108441-snap-gene-0.30 protein:Tk06083 transcript:maker-scaffold712_size108441-snap-gene-0.30-mRNA-1 annotation:"3-hydroxyanthranilate -dioxygenase"